MVYCRFWNAETFMRLVSAAALTLCLAAEARGEWVAALGEYKFTWASPRIGVAGGDAEVPARSHHLVSGMAYRF